MEGEGLGVRDWLDYGKIEIYDNSYLEFDRCSLQPMLMQRLFTQFPGKFSRKCWTCHVIDRVCDQSFSIKLCFHDDLVPWTFRESSS